jgi:hypothetical protein
MDARLILMVAMAGPLNAEVVLSGSGRGPCVTYDDPSNLMIEEPTDLDFPQLGISYQPALLTRFLDARGEWFDLQRRAKWTHWPFDLGRTN